MAVNDGDVIKGVVTIAAPDAVICQNVFYWRLSDPSPDNPSIAQILTAIDTKITDIYQFLDDVMSDEYAVDDVTAEKIEWDGAKWETVENLGLSDIGVAGLGAADALPHGAAGIITAQTSRPQTRARKFLCGLLETEVNDSTLSGTMITALAAAIVEWLADITVVGAAELVAVVVGQSGPSAGLVYDLISAAVSAIVGYQRRRKPGVGS